MQFSWTFNYHCRMFKIVNCKLCKVPSSGSEVKDQMQQHHAFQPDQDEKLPTYVHTLLYF